MNFRKILFFFSLFYICAISEAQTFIKPFFIDSSSTLAYSICTKDSFFFVTGSVNDTVVSGGVCSYLAKFDYMGNELSSITFRADNYVFFNLTISENALISTADGGMAAVGDVMDTLSKYWLLFSKFDSSGDLLFYKTYDFGFTNYQRLFGFKTIEFDSAYFLIAELDSNYYCSVVLAKLDLAGNLKLVKTYNQLPYLYSAFPISANMLSNSHILICDGRSDDDVNYWQAILKTCFLEVDTAGNLIKQVCDTDINLFAHYNLDTTYDGNYLSCGTYYCDRQQGLSYTCQDYVAKWNTNFNLEWQLLMGDTGVNNYFADFAQDVDKNIILCGQNLNSINDSGLYKACLAKVSPSGSLIWYRNYMVPDGVTPDWSWNYLTDMTLLPNGDILAVGSWQNHNAANNLFFPQLGWIIRVDSNGCLNDSTCGVAGIGDEPPFAAQKQLPPIQIFPNPSNGTFTINAMVDLPAFTEIEVYDALGRKVRTQPLFHRANLLNLTNLSSGIYFYKIVCGLSEIDEGKLVIQK
jgi:hypothetical protein